MSDLTTKSTKSAEGHLRPWTLLKPKPGTCPECGVIHSPDLPHNQQSMFWQYNFYDKNGRWPTWKDALAHCSDEMKTHWVAALKEKGIEVAA